MAQTIQIKRSSTTTAPSSLASGELAYSTKTGVQKLYYGDGTDVLAIGGKSYTDKLDGIEAGATADQTNAEIRAAVEAATDSNVFTDTDHSKLNGIEALADVTDATNVAAAGALMLTGGTLTSNLVLGDNNKVQFGGTTTNLEIYNDGATSYIKENASGDLEIHATDFTIKDGGGQTMMSFDADGVLRLYDQSETNPVEKLKTQTTGIYVNGTMNSTGIKLGNETVTISSIKDEDNMASNSATALATQQSIKAYVDASVPTSVANATTAANVTLVAENTSSDQHRIIFADSQTGSQTLQTDTSLVYQPSTGNLSLGSGGTASMGNLTLNSGTISSVQTIKGDTTLTIDPAPDDTGEVGGSTTDTGTVVILGDLRVTGETFTVNSTTVSVGDNEIVLNGDHTGTPTLDAGLRVERGSLNDAFFNWDESEDSWVVGEGQSSSPYFYTLLHSNNFETVITTLDGGTF